MGARLYRVTMQYPGSSCDTCIENVLAYTAADAITAMELRANERSTADGFVRARAVKVEPVVGVL